MRYAILSDVHGNLQAWNAVLTDLSSYGVDRILCLGDCVGYGPNPAEVLRAVHRHAHGLVLGNHDGVVCGKMSPEAFNDRAQQMIAWTQRRLGQRAGDFLDSLPLMLTGERFRCCHGAFDAPAAFDYILTPEDALRSFAATLEPLLFTGHSHVPELFVMGESGVAHPLDAQDFELEEGKRYIVNVGSVGSPRDGDVRASYVLYDTDAGAVVFRKVPFDLDAFRAAVLRAGLSVDDVPLLQSDPRQRVKDVREQLDFSPAQTQEQEAHDVVLSHDVEIRLRRSASRWRILALMALLLALAAVFGIVTVSGNRPPKPQPDIVPAVAEEIRLETDGVMGGGNVLPPFPVQLNADGGLRPWQIHFADTRVQAVTLHEGIVTLANTEYHYLRIHSPTFLVADSSLQRIVLTGEASKDETFTGTFSLSLDIRNRETGKWVQGYATAEFRKTKEGWSARKTQPLPKYADAFRVVLSGHFTGSISIRNVRAEK